MKCPDAGLAPAGTLHLIERRSVNESIPVGSCQCGCGRATTPAPMTRKNRGWVKGELRRFATSSCRPTKSPVFYRVEDRGHDTPCWIWQRGLDKGGYGVIYVDGKHDRAHRYFYEQKHGPIPPGLDGDHLCRIRACCNPDHIEPVTRSVNVLRGERWPSGRMRRQDWNAIRDLLEWPDLTEREIVARLIQEAGLN